MRLAIAFVETPKGSGTVTGDTSPNHIYIYMYVYIYIVFIRNFETLHSIISVL